jgi:8-oxo-dGTP pyrophosphatase MutT (NUDIX family)
MATTGIAEIIIFHIDRVLLVQQSKPKVYGKWGFPGGHVEEGESAEEAIIREVKEELGIAISTTGLKMIDHTEDDTDEGALLVSTFILSKDIFLPKLQTEELMGFGWFMFDELNGMVDKLRSPWMPELIKQIDAPGA